MASGIVAETPDSPQLHVGPVQGTGEGNPSDSLWLITILVLVPAVILGWTVPSRALNSFPSWSPEDAGGQIPGHEDKDPPGTGMPPQPAST